MTEPPADPVRPPLWLRLPAERDSVERARAAVMAYLAPYGLGARALYRVELVLEESLMNVLMHAYGGPAAAAGDTIELGVALAGGDIELTVVDRGPAFDPLQAPERAPPSTLEQAVPGGLGLRMLRRHARRLAYERADGRNRLTIVLAASAA